MPLYVPSQLQGRFTYATKSGAPPQLVAGFESSAQIYNLGFFLYDFDAAFHETPAAGLYVLLLDQNRAQDGSGTLFATGDLALRTLGPTTATGQVLTLPEQSSMPEMEIVVSTNYGPERRRMRGFPFDNGCVAVISTTPGRLTIPQPGQGARFTARGQVCG
jgi:hypothetical protein